MRGPFINKQQPVLRSRFASQTCLIIPIFPGALVGYRKTYAAVKSDDITNPREP